MKLITEEIVEYPTTMGYDINIWCDNEIDTPKHQWVINVTFYPLYRGADGYLHVSTDTFSALTLDAYPEGEAQNEVLDYLRNVMNDGESLPQFDVQYMDWWSNQCVLTNAPRLLADFMAQLPEVKL